MTTVQTQSATARQDAVIALGFRCLRRLEAREARRTRPILKAKAPAPAGKLTTTALRRMLKLVESMTAAERAEAARWIALEVTEHECKGAKIAAYCQQEQL